MAGKMSKTAKKKHSRRPQLHRDQSRRLQQNLQIQRERLFNDILTINALRRELEEREMELEQRGFHGGRTCYEREIDITEANIAYGRLQLRFYFGLYLWRIVLIGSSVTFFIWILIKFNFL